MSDVWNLRCMIRQHMGYAGGSCCILALIERHKSESISGALDLVTDRLYRRTVPVSSMMHLSTNWRNVGGYFRKFK